MAHVELSLSEVFAPAARAPTEPGSDNCRAVVVDGLPGRRALPADRRRHPGGGDLRRRLRAALPRCAGRTDRATAARRRAAPARLHRHPLRADRAGDRQDPAAARPLLRPARPRAAAGAGRRRRTRRRHRRRDLHPGARRRRRSPARSPSSPRSDLRRSGASPHRLRLGRGRPERCPHARYRCCCRASTPCAGWPPAPPCRRLLERAAGTDVVTVTWTADGISMICPTDRGARRPWSRPPGAAWPVAGPVDVAATGMPGRARRPARRGTGQHRHLLHLRHRLSAGPAVRLTEAPAALQRAGHRVTG